MADDKLELEAMRTDDRSWHPCVVSFSPNRDGLVINYENGSQEILVSEKEALMRIRVRSLPLQEDDCTHINPGEHVVVNQSSEPEKGFSDAEVEKVLRVRHSKRAPCRCTFVIKWLQQDLDGESLKVPSSSVMRLSDKSINDHPTISAFIDAVPLSNPCFSSMSPQMDGENDFDIDLHDLLGKQIEGIKNSLHGSKKRIRDEIVGLEVNILEQVKETDISVPDVKDLEDIRSPLNPLAARSALASLMSKRPQSVENSPNDINGIGNYSKYTEISLEIEVAPKPARSVKKSLFSTSDKMEPEIGMRTTRAKVQKAKGIPDDIIERNSSVDENKPSTVTNKRLTRSILNKEGEDLTTETTTVGTKNKPSTVTNKRLTRSVLNKEGEVLTTETTTVDTKKNPSTVTNRRLTRSVPNKEGEDPTTDTTTVGTKNRPNTVTNRRETRSVLNKEGDSLTTETTAVGTNSSSNMRRFTRSGINQETADIKTDTTKESDGDELPTEHINKKRDTEGNATSNGGSSYGSKKKNPLDLNKHKVRSSPRFRS